MTSQANERIALRDDELSIEPVSAAGRRTLGAIGQALEAGEEGVVEGLARQHPELFRVHLGPGFGPNIRCKVAKRESGEPSMPTSGTFAMRLLTWGYDGAIEALLEQGLHPDDRTVFLDCSMLGHGRCRIAQSTTALGLRHGADSNALGAFEGGKVEPVVQRFQFLFELRHRMEQGGAQPTFAAKHVCSPNVLLLLAEAGADLVVHGGYLPRAELVAELRRRAAPDDLALANEVVMRREIKNHVDAATVRRSPARRAKML